MAIKYGDNKKVTESIKAFLEKLKACDNLPDELADDALEMAEEVKDALCGEGKDEETDILEVTKDEGSGEKLDEKIEDALSRVLRKYGVVTDKATSSIDELETELSEKEEESEGEPGATKDSINVKKFIRDMKPLISSIKNANTRKRLSDSLAKMVRMNLGTTGDYSSILGAVQKNTSVVVSDAKNKTNDNDVDHGMTVASKYNPHYKEGN